MASPAAGRSECLSGAGMGAVVIGVDIGTTVTKAAAFDASGRLVARAAAATTWQSPRPGWAEVDMEALWQHVAATLRDLCARLASGDTVAAVGISAFMGGAWLLDTAGDPVRSAILWNDARAAAVLDQLRDEPVRSLRDTEDGDSRRTESAGWTAHSGQDLLARSFAISCNALTPGFSLVVLRWLRDHEPAVLERARTALFAKDWIRFRLTGELATDGSDASHAPGDAVRRTYSKEILADWGLAELASLLPPVLPSEAVAGTVTVEAAAATGLPAGTPVVTGLADVSSILVGGGVVAAGQASTILGSACLNSVVTDQPVWEPRGIGLSFLIPPARWTRTMPNQTGTLALEWFKRELAPGSDDAALDEAAARVPRGARGLLFHPYLNGTGVLAPVYEPHARGRLWGLATEHTRWDILRSIYEGVAYAVADCADLLPPATGPSVLLGGGAGSRLWRQIIADVTGRAYTVAATPEPGALGVALLGGVAAGWWSSIEEAAGACCSHGEVMEPDRAAHEEYRGVLQLYRYLRRDLVREQSIRRAVIVDGPAPQK